MTMKRTDIARRLLGATSFVVGLMAFGSAASAQAVDSRWQAWYGCWEAVDTVDSPATDAKKPRICVLPTDAPSTVEIATVIGDSVALRQRIEATGEQRQDSKDGCTGWQRATWSANGQRLYMRSSYTCAGGLTRLSNGVMAMTSGGEWLDVQGLIAGSTQGVRVARYRDVTGEGALPAEIVALLKDRMGLTSDARFVASAPLTTDDAIEATKFLDPGVAQAWLAERGDGFQLDAKKLVALEKAAVPSVVIDVMVALSYPETFALNRSRVAGASGESVAAGAYGGGRTVYLYGWDPFYSPYGYRYSRYGYGYGGWGYGGWYYDRPVIIVRQPTNDDRERHGRVSKDRGYTPGPDAPRRGGSSASRGESGSSGSSTSSGSSSRSPSGSGSSSGSGRTAKPRPPQ
jgi:hypothetical protein